MPVRDAEAFWEGSLREGQGKLRVGSGAYEGGYSWSSRFEDGQGTNPEELLAAAHAGCYSMALTSNLGKAGFKAESIHTKVQVKLEQVEGKNRITHIQLETEAKVPGIDDAKFQEIAEMVKQGCPVSVALSAVPMDLVAKLV